MGRTKADKLLDIYGQIVALKELRITKDDNHPGDVLRDLTANDSYDAAVRYLNVFDSRSANNKQQVIRTASKNQNILDAFENARVLYPGKRRGRDTEFLDLSKKHKDFVSVCIRLESVIKRQIEHREYKKNFTQEFVPEWPSFARWLKERRWEEYIPDTPNIRQKSPSEEIL